MLTGLQVKMTTKQPASQMGNIIWCAEVSPHSIFAAFVHSVRSLIMTEKLRGLECYPATLFRSELRSTETKSSFGIWRSLPVGNLYILLLHAKTTDTLKQAVCYSSGRLSTFCETLVLKKLIGYLHCVTDGSLCLSPLELSHCQTRWIYRQYSPVRRLPKLSYSLYLLLLNRQQMTFLFWFTKSLIISSSC